MLLLRLHISFVIVLDGPKVYLLLLFFFSQMERIHNAVVRLVLLVAILMHQRLSYNLQWSHHTVPVCLRDVIYRLQLVVVVMLKVKFFCSSIGNFSSYFLQIFHFTWFLQITQKVKFYSYLHTCAAVPLAILAQMQVGSYLFRICNLFLFMFSFRFFWITNEIPFELMLYFCFRFMYLILSYFFVFVNYESILG